MLVQVYSYVCSSSSPLRPMDCVVPPMVLNHKPGAVRNLHTYFFNVDEDEALPGTRPNRRRNSIDWGYWPVSNYNKIGRDLMGCCSSERLLATLSTTLFTRSHFLTIQRVFALRWTETIRTASCLGRGRWPRVVLVCELVRGPNSYPNGVLTSPWFHINSRVYRQRRHEMA